MGTLILVEKGDNIIVIHLLHSFLVVRNPVHKPFVCVGENEKLEIADVVRAINLAVCLTTGDNGSSANTPVGLSLGPRVSVFPPTNVLETPAHIFLSLKVIGLKGFEPLISRLRI